MSRLVRRTRRFSAVWTLLPHNKLCGGGMIIMQSGGAGYNYITLRPYQHWRLQRAQSAKQPYTAVGFSCVS
jgi:hypothetical protein